MKYKESFYIRLDCIDSFDGEKYVEEILKINEKCKDKYKFGYPINTPILEFRNHFLDYISSYGFSAFCRQTKIQEDIVSPSISTNEIENIVIKFFSLLNGAQRVLIIDPYLYANNRLDCTFVKRIFQSFSSNLREVFITTNGKKMSAKDKIMSTIESLNKNIKIYNLVTDIIHDRFWINLDNNSGIIVGTSLNGIGKSLLLIDKIYSEDDVKNIIKEIKKIGKELGNSDFASISEV